MRYSFVELPGEEGAILRPAISVGVEGLERAPQWCLLDTGALHNRFGGWIAEVAGIDLTGADRASLAIGGFVTTARLGRIGLHLGEAAWEGPVWFCDPWPLPFHLLGQEDFFRLFQVTLRAAEYTVDVVPEPACFPTLQ